MKAGPNMEVGSTLRYLPLFFTHLSAGRRRRATAGAASHGVENDMTTRVSLPVSQETEGPLQHGHLGAR